MYTGTESKAGTDANVSMQLFGQRGDTGLRRLLSSKTNSNKFEQGQVSCDCICCVLRTRFLGRGPDLNCNYFLTPQFKHVFWALKKQSHLDSSFEYPQHIFWLRNMKNNFQILTLIWGPGFQLVRLKGNLLWYSDRLES